MKSAAWKRKQSTRGYEIKRIARAEKRCDTKHFTYRMDDDAGDEVAVDASEDKAA
jgi:hypothetical protein